MASLLEELTSQLGGPTLNRIGAQIGADGEKAGTATAAAVSALIGALSKNAAQPDGARALHDALQKDHDGSILDDLQGFLGGGGTAPGDSILKHVLGGRRSRVESGLGQATGLDAGKVGQLLAMLAPVVLGALGKAQRREGMDSGALSRFLGGERQQIERMQPQASGLLGMLDADGDGDVDMSDVARKGLGMLGKLLKG